MLYHIFPGIIWRKNIGHKELFNAQFAIQALALPATAGRDAENCQKFLGHIFAVTAKIKSGGEIDHDHLVS
jgi:hypothetical protein